MEEFIRRIEKGSHQLDQSPRYTLVLQVNVKVVGSSLVLQVNYLLKYTVWKNANYSLH